MNRSFNGWITDTIKANPERWLLFFKKHGIQPNTEYPSVSLVQAYKKNPNAVTKEVTEILSSQIAAFDGDTTLSKVGNWFEWASVVLTGTDNLTESQQAKKLDDENADDENKKKAITAVFIFFGVCIIIIVGFIVIKHYKK